MSDQYRKLPTETLLRRVASARAAGDWTAARGEWEACIARARERVVNVVETYVAKGWIPRDMKEDVVQEALIRGARRLVRNLDSLAPDAFFAAMVRVAEFQCRDEGRRVMRREQHERSLDEPAGWSDDESAGRYDAALNREATSGWERAEDARDADRLFDELVPQLKNARARRIILMQRLGIKDAQIAAELDISVANVHTIRSRALKELRGLIDP